MNTAVIIGGAGGIGLSIASNLTNYDKIYLLDIKKPEIELKDNMEYIHFDLCDKDYSILDRLNDINSLIITAGFGHLGLFGDYSDDYIEKSFTVNTVGILKVINHYFNKISSHKPFYTAIMVSISGLVSSPFFSIYSATKAALHRFIESVNVELEKKGVENRILEVSPGSIQGTGFNGGTTDLNVTKDLACEIIKHMNERELIFIPKYQEIFKDVVTRYNNDPHSFGLESYDYKLNSGRVKS